jgi:hypothetical protein
MPDVEAVSCSRLIAMLKAVVLEFARSLELIWPDVTEVAPIHAMLLARAA